jgi:hypothetical protein
LYRACASHDVLHDVLADRRVNKRGWREALAMLVHTNTVL